MKYKVGDKVKAISKSIGCSHYECIHFGTINKDNVGWILGHRNNYYIVGNECDVNKNRIGHKFLESDLISAEENDMEQNNIEMGAAKNNVVDGKLGYNYIHPAFLYQVGAVMQGGAIKYADWNYLKGHKASDLINALKRHIDQWFYSREDFDPDMSALMGMNISHLANAAACINMLLAQVAEGTMKDDRPPAMQCPTTKGAIDKIFKGE